jgi:long-chain fatty acid transport protein
MRVLVALFVFLPSLARASGFELVEQSPAGVAMVGAQTAVADSPSAIFYNPAGMAFQRGLAVEAGTIVLRSDVNVHAPDGTPNGGGTMALPAVYLVSRLGPHFGAGIGVFSNFAEHLGYPEAYAALHPGFVQSFSFRTTTIAPSVAFRPFPWIALGLGIDFVPASLDLTVGGPVGTLSPVAMSGVGFGANVGLLVEPVKRWLKLAATYRGAIDLDLSGSAYGAFVSSTTVPLPHNFTFAASSRPLEALTIDVEAHVTLSSDFHSLSIDLKDPKDPKSKTTLAVDTNQRDAWGVRGGGEYRFLDGKMRARLGLGWDQTPVRRGWLGPLTPDSQRVVVGAGLGGTLGNLSVDLGYSAQIVLSRTSSNPVPGMTSYDALRHLIALSVTVRLPNVGPRVDLPEYKH